MLAIVILIFIYLFIFFMDIYFWLETQGLNKQKFLNM